MIFIKDLVLSAHKTKGKNSFNHKGKVLKKTMLFKENFTEPT